MKHHATARLQRLQTSHRTAISRPQTIAKEATKDRLAAPPLLLLLTSTQLPPSESESALYDPPADGMGGVSTPRMGAPKGHLAS